jgi:hypothetical protein
MLANMCLSRHEKAIMLVVNKLGLRFDHVFT